MKDPYQKTEQDYKAGCFSIILIMLFVISALIYSKTL